VQKTIAVETGSDYYDGAAGRLHYRFWKAEAPSWVVLLAHGFGDHSGRWDRYGRTLAEAGGAVLACDHRGHGLSEGPRAVVEDFEVTAADFLKLYEMPEFPEGVPVALTGHSMGGLIATTAAVFAEPPIDALIVSGARIGGWETAERLLTGIDAGEVDPADGAGHPLLDPNAPLRLDALSRDPAVAEMFIGDDLAYKGPYPLETLRAFVAVTGKLKTIEDAVSVPLLYMHGGADPITAYRPSVDRMLQLASGDVEVRIFAGARHSIYNEINRDEIYGVLLAFLERVARTPGGTA
jgi:alpha-beta hydrolase superfamily lysophospholipase